MKGQDKKKIEHIARKYGLKLLLLFGSRAENNKYVRKDSDFDIAYLSEKDLDLKNEAKLSGELAKVFKSSKIDVVSLKKSPPLLMKQIFDNNLILYCENKTIYNKYMIYAENKYAEARPLFNLQKLSINRFLKKHA